MNMDDLPLTREQLTIVGMAVALVTVAAAAPALLAPSAAPTTDDATNGTVYSENRPQNDDATPSDDDDGPIRDLSNEPREPETDLSQVPDSHVQSNGTKPPVSASVGSQTLRVATMEIDGQPALNLTDSREHDGRWVSVSAEWLKSEYGTVPEVVGIHHESGETYSEAVHSRNGNAIFWVRGFSTNVVTFGGVLEIVGQPATTGTTHLYEIRELDSASDPAIELTGQVNSERDTKKVIEATDGETIPLSVAGENLQPQNAEVTFTGVEQQSTDANLFSTVLTDGDSTSYSVDGNSPATDVSVTFTGYEARTDRSVVAENLVDGDTTTYSVGGTRAATDASVTFVGDSTTSTTSVSGSNLANGESFDYTVDGNRNANDAVVTFTGDSTTSATTASASNVGNGGQFGFTVDGNRDATGVSVEFTGDSTFTTNDQSGSGISVDGSDSITTSGNLDPSGPASGNPRLTITPNSRTVGSGYYDLSDPSGAVMVGSDGSGGYYRREAGIQNAPARISQINLGIKDVGGWVDADIYIASGGPDGNFYSGTKVASTRIDSAGTHSISLNTPYDHNGGSVHISIVPTDTESSGTTVGLKRSTSKDSAPSNWLYYGGFYKDQYASIELQGSSATGLSVTASDGTSISLGAVHGSESAALPISPSASSLDFSASQGGTFDYSLEKTDRTATENPSIDVDGDGSDEASHIGVLTSGNTETVSISNLAPGSHTATVTTGHQVDVSVDYTERSATIDPSIDVDGDGSDEASYNGMLTDGEVFTAAVPNLAPGTYSASVDTGYQVDAQIGYTERFATKDPAVDLDGDGSVDASYSGVLLAGESVTKAASNLETGSHTATVQTGYQTDVTINYTERTTTEDPSVDLDGDGQVDASYSGVLPAGDTVTRSVGNISSGSQTATVSTVHKVGIEAGSTVRTLTEDPTLDIDGDGQVEAESLGKLAEGESQTVQIDDFDRNVTSATVGTGNGVVDVQIGYSERVISERPGVVVNNHTLRVNGTLSQDDTASLTANSSWLQQGQNNVTVLAGDGDISTDAPDPTVAITYTHELTTRRTVTFEDQAFSERYNLSRTYLSSRESATLTIPHADNIISLRTLQVRVDESGDWTTIPQSSLTMDGTSAVIDVASLTGGTVPADTTVEIRSTGSKIDVHNGSVTVVETTPVGFDLDSRVRLDSWSTDSYISVRNTTQGHLLHYGANESYSAESDYAELSVNHGQRVHFPEAAAGSEVGLKTTPLVLSPENGTIRASVPEDRTNETAPVFYVSPGERTGESFTVEYTGASQGSWYGVYEVDTSKRFDRTQGRQQMTVPSDGIDSLIRVKTAPAPSTNPNGASTVFEAANQGNLVPLAILFGAIAGLVIVGRRPERSRGVVKSVASRTGSLVERIPRGEVASGAVEAAITAVGGWIITIGENELLTAAIGVATVAAAIQSGLLQIGPEAGAIGTVAAIAVASLLVLTRTDNFTTARWLGIVGVSAVVSLQALGEGDLLTTLVESDAFVLVLILVGYVAIQLVREYRANNSPDDDQPEINIVAGRGGSDD